MTNTERLLAVQAELTALGVKVEVKDQQWYWKAINVLLLIVSFGQMKRFMVGFNTTLGNRIGVTQAFMANTSDAQKYATLRHELQHIKQFRRYGFGNIWVGTVLCAIPYLFLPLPIGLAYCRAQMEKEAYAETIRAWVQCEGRDVAMTLKSHIVANFTGVNYLYMWPFKVSMEKWFDATLERVCIEEGV